jgi:glycosyltransferase involved in cell wall biosynthesis
VRILVVTNTPWTRNLGAPRVQLELAEQWRALGHVVEKFSGEDAFPLGSSRLLPRNGFAGRVTSFLRISFEFSRRARAFVREHADRYDVIDATLPDLPFSKRDLRFAGLLVARSVVFVPAYAEFDREARRRWPEPKSVRRAVHDLLTAVGRRQRVRDVEPSLRHADLVNVSSREDLEAVRDRMGSDARTVLFPFGVSAERFAEFDRARAGVEERLARQTVAFIGTWNPRKGSRDWPEIVRLVRERRPGVRFLFLGTGLSAERVLGSFPPDLRPNLEAVPLFENTDLPKLLARATVGAFPGYLEAFGFSVLEKLAAGLPTVTYDAPGPREMMRHHALCPMSPPGDLQGFSAELAGALSLSPERYREVSDESRRVASLFRWEEIARETVELYARRLQEERR